ncbi:hypothetical protein SUGI_0015020 [Cryptomeria japonica]|nr:hypothetical protein SUGI_0015020 [Cryptomeria japonica]
MGVPSLAHRHTTHLELAVPKPRFESPSILESYLLWKNNNDQIHLANAHPSLSKVQALEQFEQFHENLVEVVVHQM